MLFSLPICIYLVELLTSAISLYELWLLDWTGPGPKDQMEPDYWDLVVATRLHMYH